MADTLTPEKWGRKESADWWSAGQAARQQLYGAATETMLELAGVQAGSRVLDVAAGTGAGTTGTTPGVTRPQDPVGQGMPGGASR